MPVHLLEVREMRTRLKRLEQSASAVRRGMSRLREDLAALGEDLAAAGEDLAAWECAEDARLKACVSLPNVTRMERVVLDGYALGQSRRELAAVLCLSVKTIDFHTQRALYKLGVHSVAKAMYIMHQEALRLARESAPGHGDS